MIIRRRRRSGRMSAGARVYLQSSMDLICGIPMKASGGKKQPKDKTKYKAIKNILLRIDVYFCSDGYFWSAYVPYHSAKILGTETDWTSPDSNDNKGEILFKWSGEGFYTQKDGMKNWEKFAKRNGLTKWKYIK